MDKDNFKLDVGALLQVEILSGHLHTRFNARLVGYVPGVSMLITWPQSKSFHSNLLDGDELAVRFLDDGIVYGFITDIKRICTDPFKYIHLRFPEKVESAVVRKAQRIEACAVITFKGKTNEDSVEAKMVDISVGGIGFEIEKDLGNIGDNLTLCAKFSLDDREEEMQLSAVIRNITTNEDSKTIRYGVEFENLEHHDELFLRRYVHEQITQERG